MITMLAVSCYTAISSDCHITNKLLRTSNQRRIFVSAVRKKAESSSLLRGFLSAECRSEGRHRNFNLIVQCAFNRFSVNELKRLNSKPIAMDPPTNYSERFKN